MKTIFRTYPTQDKANEAIHRALESGRTVDWMRPEPDGIHVSFSRQERPPMTGRKRLSRRTLITLGLAVPLCLCALATGIAALSQEGQPTPTSLAAVVPPSTAAPAIPPTSSPEPVPTTTSPAAPPSPAASALPSPSPYTPATAGIILARVTRVIDGDTIEVEIDGRVEQLRYIGIDTPEHGLPWFQESTDANRALVEGQTVRLERDVSERDRYGRLLAYVYLTSGTFVNGALVSQGLADSVAYPPDTSHQAELDAIEEQAKAQGLGMWVQAAPVGVVIDGACSQFNSPGDDNYSKEEEYVCVTNQGTVTVDMTRWWIRDKAGATYYFPAFSLAAGASVRVRTGCGQPTSTDLYWCKDGNAVWNNGGDTAYLYSSQDQLVDQLTY